jgi:ZIP family zinc transporter
MSAERAALLGAIAGCTIFLGLPLGRLRALSPQWRAFLSVLSAGILLFIFWDVVTAAHDIVEASLVAARDHGDTSGFAVRVVMLFAGLGTGAFALAALERALMRRRPLPPISGGATASATEAGIDVAAINAQTQRAALTLGMLIALAIGLHNFSEGLAIGVSARAGEVGLVTVLIVGFALHNATEGFGIVGPLGNVRPSWRWLFVAGLVGGGPTFAGTLIGYRVTSEPLELAFYALAAGAILYVIGQLWNQAQRHIGPQLVIAGIVIGFLAGFASDLVITWGGG